MTAEKTSQYHSESDFHEALHRTKLFEHLAKREFEAVCQQLVLREYQSGELILTEGEVGDHLYIVISGAVRVFTFNKEGKEIVLARLERGEYFGEQALLSAIPQRRNASVRALTTVKTLTLSHSAFQQSLEKNANLLQLLKEHGKKELIAKFLKQLHEQEKKQKQLFALFNRIESFEEREVFFRQGDPPTYAFYLLSGKIEVRFYGEDFRLISRSEIAPGQFFGEQGVLENLPRAGTAVAIAESQVAVIEAETLHDLYWENVNFKALIQAQRSLYQIPTFGLVMQYQGSFLGRPAMNTTIHKENGETITASRLVHEDVFAIYYPEDEVEQRETFQDADDHSREILLSDQRLVGVISIGRWDDLDEICGQVIEKVFITKDNLQIFRSSGQIKIAQLLARREGNLCECMQVKQQKVQELILNGMTTIEEISKKTGAGTVCGGCRPRIIELLGGEAWAYVKIVQIREHHKDVRSYQLYPLKNEIVPSLAGQHIVIEANIDGLWVARSYTLTSIADDRFYEITVKREEFGLFSRWLYTHDKESVVLRISDPQGEYIFDPEMKSPAVCLMAGIGITPAIAFARKLTAKEHQRPLHIDYSVHQAEDAVFRDELASWPTRYPHISVNIRITSQQGRIGSQEILELKNRYPDADFFICGPKPYQTAISKALAEFNVPANRIHIEEFTNAGEPFGATHYERSSGS